jgi:hypothetical protein
MKRLITIAILLILASCVFGYKISGLVLSPGGGACVKWGEVGLYATDTSTVPTTTCCIDANCGYEFTGLSAGTYYVQVIRGHLIDYMFTWGKSTRISVTITSGDKTQNLTASISTTGTSRCPNNE